MGIEKLMWVKAMVMQRLDHDLVKLIDPEDLEQEILTETLELFDEHPEYEEYTMGASRIVAKRITEWLRGQEDQLSHLVDPADVVYNIEDIEDEVFNTTCYDALIRAMTDMKHRYQAVIICRFGLVGTPLTLKETGKLLGVTQERVRQIEAKALRELRHPSRARRLRGYLY